MNKTMDRRGFGRACLGLAAASLAAPALTRAADLPHLDEANPQANALGYHADVTTVDKAKFANFVDGSNCANCALYQGGEGWGPCSLFPGQAVSANGWCSAYAKKPA